MLHNIDKLNGLRSLRINMSIEEIKKYVEYPDSNCYQFQYFSEERNSFAIFSMVNSNPCKSPDYAFFDLFNMKLYFVNNELKVISWTGGAVNIKTEKMKKCNINSEINTNQIYPILKYAFGAPTNVISKNNYKEFIWKGKTQAWNLSFSCEITTEDYGLTKAGSMRNTTKFFIAEMPYAPEELNNFISKIKSNREKSNKQNSYDDYLKREFKNL